MKTTLNQKPRRTAGFTLTELMVVILIIGLLVGVVGPKAIDIFFKSQRDVARIELVKIKQALDQCAISSGGRYPESLEDLVTEDEQGYKFLDEDEVPLDPWGFEYVYEPPLSGGKEFELYSVAADGSPGGEGEGKDVVYGEKEE